MVSKNMKRNNNIDKIIITLLQILQDSQKKVVFIDLHFKKLSIHFVI